MSDQVEQRLGEILHNPTTDPYGNPIPGTDGVSDGISMELALRMGESTSGTVTRIGEPIQAETEVLDRLRSLRRCVRGLGLTSRLTLVRSFLR